MNEDQDLLEHASEDAAELEERLRSIHQAFGEVLSAGLSRRALIVLIRDLDSSLRLRDIDRVLHAMGSLDVYLRDDEPAEGGGS